MKTLLEEVRQLGASDLHITEGRPPIVRIAGTLKPLSDIPLWKPSTCEPCFSQFSQRLGKHPTVPSARLTLPSRSPGTSAFASMPITKEGEWPPLRLQPAGTRCQRTGPTGRGPRPGSKAPRASPNWPNRLRESTTLACLLLGYNLSHYDS